ncbi:hypothetical protein QBC99_002556 [Beijerinckia sp. GAS462]|nr:hypothetical protein [Beijerinckia sp. GAS462]SEC47455.1 Transglycosylase SLT domain-containing protein [Beijerinckia sp. 28-YEA-48]
MHRFSSALLATGVLLAVVPARAQDSTRYNQDITELSKRHHVPERLIHRIIVRESRYNPRALHAGNYGLMQIKPATARGMGYRGSPAGLLDGKTNLTYAVPYLANAYRVAGGNEDRAVQLYAGGYYYIAKRRGMLGALRTAHVEGTADGALAPTPVVITEQVAMAQPVQAYAAAPASPFAGLASLFSPQQPEQPAAAAPEPEPQVEQAALEEKSKSRKRRKHRTAPHRATVPLPPTMQAPQPAAEAAGSR